MTQPTSSAAAFFATTWGKVIGLLAIVSLLLGVYIEFNTAIQGTLDTRVKVQATDASTFRPPTQEEQDKAVCANAELRRMFPAVKCDRPKSVIPGL